jgi:mRNA interferase RelE/StbE
MKELSKLDRRIARRVHTAVLALADEPRPPGCRQLVGYPGLWRTRVGDYRVIYTIEDDNLLVLVLRIAHRSTSYNRL